ncbi:MAG: HEPN-associated N-terminal domain-containing protein [Bryobacteraceae bacterium]
MTADKYVCNKCVLDKALSALILEEGEEHPCDYCGETPTDLRCLTINRLAQHIYDNILREYSDVDSEMVSYDNEEGCYYSDTYTTLELLTDEVEFEADEMIIDDMVDALPNLTWCKKRFGPADLTAALRAGWQVFVDLVKHHNRYLFDDHANPAPDRNPFPPSEAFGVTYDADEGVPPARILDALGAIVPKANLITTIDAGTVLFRARVHATDEHPSTPAELGPPPREKAYQSNRMSPAGIVMFYGAFDRETAIAETFHRGREGAEEKVISVAQFRCQKPLTVLDLTDLPSPPSFFVDREIRHGIRFLHMFEEDFVKPVARDGMEHVEYVPTQIVTEYFRHRFRTGSGESLDGIVYRSSQNERRACVFFFDSSSCGGETGFSRADPVLQLQESATERIGGEQLIKGSSSIPPHK